MIRLIYAGHLGNNLFNYALARTMAEELDLALGCETGQSGEWGHVETASGIVDKLPSHFQMFEAAPQSLPGRQIASPQLRYVMGEKLGWHGQTIHLPRILKTCRDRRIVLYGYFQRAEYYLPYAERIRQWYRLKPVPLPVTPGPRDAIVHVRRSLDMRMLDRRLDVSYYTRALEIVKPDRVYVCGLGMDQTLRDALARYEPTYLDLDAGMTLQVMTKFRRIVMANSTFSWWGAFLSEAETIVGAVPERGFMSVEDAEVDLRVPDARYTYLEDAPLEPWRFLVSTPGWSFLREGSAVILKTQRFPPTRLNASPMFVELLEWLATRSEPFGFHETREAGLPPRAKIGPILSALLQTGVLELVNIDSKDPAVLELLTKNVAFGAA